MYAWGGSTDGWKNPGAYDYGSARASYDKAAKDAGATGPRDYSTRGTPNKTLVDTLGKEISSDSPNPLVVAIDVTGSMSTWPGKIFDRLPLLYQTLAKYRPDLEIAFAAIGDATCDDYPLQVTDFAKDIKSLEANLRALGAEGGGGGQTTESYELFGYFMREHCKTPKATTPFLIMYGDEQPYEHVDQKQVKRYIGDELQSPLPSNDIWKSLAQKFNVYLLHKPYNEGRSKDVDVQVTARWAEALGKEKIIELPNADRAVDIAIGLIAKKWGEYGDFTKSLNARHDDTSVKKAVHHSLRHIPGSPLTTSVSKKTSASKLTKPLVDD